MLEQKVSIGSHAMATRPQIRSYHDGGRKAWTSVSFGSEGEISEALGREQREGQLKTLRHSAL